MTELLASISLRVWHPRIHAAELVEAFGLAMEVGHSVGVPKLAPNGRAIGGSYEETYVSMSMVRKELVELDAQLLLCYESIRQHAALIDNLVSTGGEVEFYVSALLTEPCGFNFDRSFMDEFAKTGMGLSVELYPDAVLAE